MYDTIYFTLQGTNTSRFQSMIFQLSADMICDRFLEGTSNSNLNHQKVIPNAWLIMGANGDLGIDSGDLETSGVLNC